jgi:regulator of sigma E protease
MITTITSLLSKSGFIGAGIIGLGFLIAFHELGHFIFCKFFSIRTPSFSVGFGPKLISKKIGETEFSLSVIPLGGYVEIAGAAEIGQGEQKDALATDKHSFAKKPYYQKLLVMLGGIMFNLFFSYFALILLFAVGLPDSPLTYSETATKKIEKVVIEVVGHIKNKKKIFNFRENDVLTSINGTLISNPAKQIETTIKESSNNIAEVVIKRNNKTYTVEFDTNTLEQNAPHYFGVIFKRQTPEPMNFTQAFNHGIKATNNWIAKTVESFFTLFKKRNVKQFAGPLAIISMTSSSAQSGWKVFLLFLAIISINLAVLNLLPLPILDGGQLLFHTIEAIIGRQLPIKIKEYIFIASWLMILSLMLYLSFFDIKRIITSCFG